MRKEITIVFICNEYPPGNTGGIGVFTKKIAEGLAHNNFNVYVVGLYANIEKKLEENINSVKVIRLPSNLGLNGLITNRIVLYKAIKSISNIVPIDIIECPDFEGCMAYIPKVAKNNVTRLHGSHTYFSSERKVKPSSAIYYLEKKQLKSACEIVSVSLYTARRTQELFNLNKQPNVIYNSIDVEKFSSEVKVNYKTQKKAIYFGTLAEKKGIYPLAKAWQQFSKDNPDWVLTVVGKDAMEKGKSNKKEMVRLLGKAKNTVKFIEHLDNEKLVRSLKTYDFAVLPSFSEAFALAPLEAMAAGLPVIISNMSSGPELVKHGIDGWLCDPLQPHTLVERMNEAACSEPLRKTISKAALNKINTKFNFNAFIEKNINFYEDLLSK